MTRDDIITVDIDEDMIIEAKLEATERQSKWGRKTRNAYQDRDIIGSLAHQVVEQYLDSTTLAYQTFRTQNYERGDTTDIIFDRHSIDVKGTHGQLNEKYFYNQGFLVFKQQLDDPKIDDISHFMFVQVEPDHSQGHIYGIIEVQDFLDKASPVTLKYENMQIRAFQLTPIRRFIYRV